MTVTTRAIVFSAIKYAEADLIANCYTEAAGIQTYLLRGILKSKKGKLKPSYFQPLTQLEIVATQRNKGSMEYIKEAKVANPYNSLHTQIVKSTLVMFLAEMLKNCIREEEPDRRLFGFLEYSLQWLDGHEQVSNFHIFFLLQLSRFLGFYPDATNIKAPFFNIIEGRFQNTQTDDYCFEGPIIENFKKFFSTNYEGLADIKLSKTERQKVLELLLSYYQCHVQGYRKPKSLSVLHQLFA